MPPERILLFGLPGAGKSKSAHAIATKLAMSGSRARMFVVDTDFGWDRFLAAEGNPGNVIVRQMDNWDGYVKAIKEAQTQGNPGDWVVIDQIGVAWEMAQNAYIERAYGKDPIEFLLEARKSMKKNAGMGAALSGMGDWPFIKRMYRGAMNDLIAQSKLHVIGITTQEKIWDSDMPDTMATYNRLGGKPGGEKHLDYGFHTVIQCGQNFSQKTWWLTVAKDRGRRLPERELVGDFSVDYLVSIAGWQDPTALAVAAVRAQVNGANGGETAAAKLARIKAMRGAAS
jgi:hypothetical protein